MRTSTPTEIGRVRVRNTCHQGECSLTDNARRGSEGDDVATSVCVLNTPPARVTRPAATPHSRDRHTLLATSRGLGRVPGTSLYTRKRLSLSLSLTGATANAGASLHTRKRPYLTGPRRKPGASVYTRKPLSLSQGPGRMPSASLYTPKRISASHFMCCNLTGMRVDDMASIIYQALPQSALQPKRPKAGVSYGG